MNKSFLCGLDLGKMSDYTALVIAEVTLDTNKDNIYLVRYIHRWNLGTEYYKIARDVRVTLERLPDAPLKLAVDATGVGVPVVEILAREDLPCVMYPITITPGSVSHLTPDGWHVPKQELVSTLKILLQARPQRLKIVKSLPEAGTLIEELQNFEEKVTKSANEIYNAREGSKDDLCLATCILTWLGERLPRPYTGPIVLNGPPMLGEEPEPPLTGDALLQKIQERAKQKNSLLQQLEDLGIDPDAEW